LINYVIFYVSRKGFIFVKKIDMTKIILEISEPSQLDKLYAYMKRLKMNYKVQPVLSQEEKRQSNLDDIFKVIESGALNIPDIDTFMKEFEESRQDRPLPFRD
jgi:hypothetical protein